MKILPLAATALVALTSGANAATYMFSYDFGSGSVLEGELEGTLLQADMDTIFIEDVGDVRLDSVLLSDIESSDIRSASDFQGDVQPVVSLSGASMDVFVCAQGFRPDNCQFANQGGFLFETVFQDQVIAGDGYLISESETFSAARWSIELKNTGVVPLPATLPLTIGVLGVFGVMGAKRRRRAA